MLTKKSVFSLLLFLCILLSATQVIFCQENDSLNPLTISKKHTFGFQLNPYLNESNIDRLFSGDLEGIYWTAALRYLNRQPYHHNFFIGFEGNVYWRNHYWVRSRTWHIGPLFRYEFVHYKRLTLFIETLPSINYDVVKYNQDEVPESSRPFVDSKQFSGGVYLAPGISFRSQNDRLSLDISFKVANYYFGNGKKYVPSFKISFHF